MNDYIDEKIMDTILKENPIRERSFLSSEPKLISDLSAEENDIEWIWEGYLAKGHMTLFSALWKAGKSTLIAQLLKSIQNRKEFAGQATTKTKVFILSEESESIWARRAEDLGLSEDVWLLCRPIKARLNYQQWIELLKYCADFCKEKGIELFIVDTLSGFWNVKDENNAAEVDSALLPLNELLEKQISVLLVHHFRKSGGQEGVASRGSGALGSRADVLVEFTRLESSSADDTHRVLRSYSRFDETPVESVIELVNGEYIARGTRNEVKKEAKHKVVLNILEANGSQTAQEIVTNWDTDLYGTKPQIRTIRNYLKDLLLALKVKVVSEKIVGKSKTQVFDLPNVYAEISDEDDSQSQVEQRNLGLEK